MGSVLLNIADVSRAVCEQLIEQFALAQLSMSISDTYTEPTDAYCDTQVADVLDDMGSIDQQLGMFTHYKLPS